MESADLRWLIPAVSVFMVPELLLKDVSVFICPVESESGALIGFWSLLLQAAADRITAAMMNFFMIDFISGVQYICQSGFEVTALFCGKKTVEDIPQYQCAFPNFRISVPPFLQ
jgi:hypothetical protein